MAYIENSASKITRTLRLSRTGWSRVESSLADEGTRRTDRFNHYNGDFFATIKVVTRQTEDGVWDMRPEESIFAGFYRHEGESRAIFCAILTSEDWWQVVSYTDDDDLHIRSFGDVIKLWGAVEMREVRLQRELAADAEYRDTRSLTTESV